MYLTLIKYSIFIVKSIFEKMGSFCLLIKHQTSFVDQRDSSFVDRRLFLIRWSATVLESLICDSSLTYTECILNFGENSGLPSVYVTRRTARGVFFTTVGRGAGFFTTVGRGAGFWYILPSSRSCSAEGLLKKQTQK